MSRYTLRWMGQGRLRRALRPALVVLSMATGCARNDVLPVSEAPSATVAPRAGTFAIYEVDDLHDITAGVTTLPAGVEIFRQKEEPRNGYFYAALPGESQANTLHRLRTWCDTLHIPEGDTVLFGTTTSTDVQTYLVKSDAILDARGVAGAMAIAMAGDGWGVALTFAPDAMQSLAVALSKPGSHFRIMVQGLVEKGPFELLDESSRTSLAGPHGSLSTTDWVCSDHRAVLTMSARGRVGAKARAESLAAALPRFRSAEECRKERTDGRPR